MNMFFGFISASTLTLVAIGIVSVILLCLLILAARHRVLFKISLRNITRRRTQALLITCGLVLSTVLIMTSFGLGDSLGYSFTANKLNQLGNIDECVSIQPLQIGNSLPYMKPAEVKHLLSVIRSTPQVAFASGAFFSGVPIPLYDQTSKQISGKNMLIAVPSDFSQVWGPLQNNIGQNLHFADLQPGEAFLSQSLADKLNAKAGDTLHVIIDQKSVTYVVRAVLNTDVNLDTASATGSGGASLVVPLAQYQQLVGKTDQVNTFFIRNIGTGGLDDLGVNNSTSIAVTQSLQTKLNSYNVQSIKQDAITNARNSGASVTLLVFLIGTFLIIVGMLLIYLIFVMLATERQTEMGMSRAIGMKRSHLTLMFAFEGMIYTLISAGIGLLVGAGLVSLLIQLLGNNSVLMRLFKTTVYVHIDWTSPIIAYCLGTTLTFFVVTVSANRVSRMNIIAAIRHLDEGPTSQQEGSLFWMLGPPACVAGIVVLIIGLRSQLLVPYTVGVALLIVGIGMTICWIIGLLKIKQKYAERLTLSITGLLLMFYLLKPFGPLENLLGIANAIGLSNFPAVDHNFYLAFLFIICLLTVISSIWLVLYNGDWFTKAIEGLFRYSGRLTAVIRTSTEYPLTYKPRTGLTIAMFALVTFIIVFMVTLNATYVQTYSNLDQVLGGWQFLADMPSGLPHLPATITKNPKVQHDFQVIGGTSVQFLSIRQAGQGVQAAFNTRGMAAADDQYLSNTTYDIQPRAAGYASSHAVWDAVKNEVGVAVLYNDPLRPIPGIKVTDTGFKPFYMEIADAHGAIQRVKVIGFLNPQALQILSFISLKTDAQLLHNRVTTDAHVRFYFRTKPGIDVNQARLDLGEALSPYGIEPVVIVDAFTIQAVAPNSFEFNFLASYIALGLFIGIAGLGVISSRAVIERRQQIGLLRAIGCSKRLVQSLFLVESSYIALLGLTIGTILGILTTKQFLLLDAASATLTPQIPVLELVAILLGAYLSTLLATYLPARAAMKVKPAEALRYE